MLGCLTLVNRTHVATAEPGRTACGITVVGEVDPALFAEPASAATCESCRQESRPDAKTLVRRYFAEEAGAAVLVDDLIADGPRVVARYHAATGPAAPQTAIFTVGDGHVAGIEAVVDDLGLFGNPESTGNYPQEEP